MTGRNQVLLSVERAKLGQARVDAVRVINLLAAEATAEKPMDMDRCITIIDELGAHLLTVSFRDALHWRCVGGTQHPVDLPTLS